MEYKGDFLAGDEIPFKFTLVDGNGQPFNASGVTAVVYKHGSTTEASGNVVLTGGPYDSRPGLFHGAVVTSGNVSFFTNGNDYDVVLSAGLVGSIPVEGYIVAAFSLKNRTGIVDRYLGRNIAGGSDGGRTVTEAMYGIRNKVAITAIDSASGVMRVYGTDDTTESWTAIVSRTAGANPLTAIDPS